MGLVDWYNTLHMVSAHSNEFSVVFTIDRDTHTATATKDRTNVFEGIEPFVITPETGKMVIDWCAKGIELDPEKPVGLQLISQVAFEKAVQRIEKGEKELIDKIRGVYLFSPEQTAKLQELSVPV